MVETLSESFQWERLHLVVGMSGDKDIESVCGTLAQLAGHKAFACRYSSSRSAEPRRVADALREAGVPEVQEYDTVEAAVEAARLDAVPDDLILVTGSFYTVADARPLFVGA